MAITQKNLFTFNFSMGPPMKRLCKKVFLFGLIIYAVPAVYIEFFPMNFQNLEYPMWKYKRDMVRDEGGIYHDILVMGDSRCLAGIIPAKLSENALSLAVGGGTPVENYYILKNYLKYNRPPKKILLSYTPFFFERHSFFLGSTARFKFLTDSEMEEVIDRAIKLQCGILDEKDTPIDSGYKSYWAYLKYRLNLVHIYRAELTESLLFCRRSSNLEKYKQLLTSKGHSLFGTSQKAVGTVCEVGKSEFKPYQLYNSYFNDFIELCNKYNIQIIYHTAPYSEISYKEMNKRYIKQYFKYIKLMGQKYPKVVFDPTLPVFDNNLFGDNSHVNYRGAKTFTNYLKEKYFN